MNRFVEVTLVGLQCFTVLFVALHNWVPLGRLNDVRAARAEFPTGKLIRVTLLNLTPVAVGLAASVHYFGRRQPDWVFWWLSITYGLACYGSLKAWWIPYLFGADAARIAREQGLYGATHSFLPERHGIRPNTLHMAFDAATLGILVGLTISRL